MDNYQTLKIERDNGCVTVTLNRPEARNAMNRRMVEELRQLVGQLNEELETRLIILRGAGGHFCAGGDIADMSKVRAEREENQRAMVAMNREFGHMIHDFDNSSKTVIAALEGAVLGGGFGLACVADVALVTADARLGMPETTLGLPPAQIIPFVVERIGLSQAKRLALTGHRFDGREAVALGLAHHLCADSDELDARLAEVRAQVLRCAPLACEITKQLLLATRDTPTDKLLDQAAEAFGDAVDGPEAMEGLTAFIQKRDPEWANTQ